MNLNQGTQPIRVAIIGTAARSSYLYGPMLKALDRDMNLVSVWGRTSESAKKLGEGSGRSLVYGYWKTHQSDDPSDWYCLCGLSRQW